MRLTIVLRIAGAVLLVGAALLLRREAGLARVEADAWLDLATLRYDAAQPDASAWASAGFATADLTDARRRVSTVEYWLGRYDTLATEHGGDADPDVLFAAANATYRVVRRDTPVGAETARRLDSVLQAYANVLRAEPAHADAAYNFEYVARIRDVHARMRPVPATKGDRESARAAPPLPTTDLPRGPTVHGLPGGPPPDRQSEEFEILTPRDLGEREADPEQAPGARMRRKG